MQYPAGTRCLGKNLHLLLYSMYLHYTSFPCSGNTFSRYIQLTCRRAATGKQHLCVQCYWYFGQTLHTSISRARSFLQTGGILPFHGNCRIYESPRKFAEFCNKISCSFLFILLRTSFRVTCGFWKPTKCSSNHKHDMNNLTATAICHMEKLNWGSMENIIG